MEEKIKPSLKKNILFLIASGFDKNNIILYADDKLYYVYR